jgi:mannose-1-phosphate guanylyltransferase
LWPYSRKERPKQFLTLNSSKTLIEQTLDRVRPLVYSNDQLWVVTNKDHANSVREYLGDQVGTILTEPASRNTGPAVIYSCLEIYKKDPDALVLFLPADAYIPEHEYGKVLVYLDNALSFVEAHNRISIFGMTPSRPEIGYGYIEFDRTEGDSAPFYRVKKFHEKPNRPTAEEYLRLGTFAWNITMFCAPVRTVLEECRHVCPKLVVQVEQAVEGAKRYDEVDNIAIEPALMEKSKHIWVLPVSFDWCDVGNVGVFLSLKDSIKNQKVVAIDAKNNLVDVPDKIVALIGIDDLCIVQTKDALLITKRDEAEKVRYVVQHLQQNNLGNYL